MDNCRQFKINILDDTNKNCKDCQKARSKHKQLPPKTLGQINTQSQKVLITAGSFKPQMAYEKACLKFIVSLKEDL